MIFLKGTGLLVVWGKSSCTLATGGTQTVKRNWWYSWNGCIFVCPLSRQMLGEGLESKKFTGRWVQEKCLQVRREVRQVRKGRTRQTREGSLLLQGDSGSQCETRLRVTSPASLHITSPLPSVRTAPGQSRMGWGLPHMWIQRILVAWRWPQVKRLLEVGSSNVYWKRRPGRIKTGRQECLLHAWNFAQCYYCVPAWMRGGLGGEWIPVYVCLSPFTVHLQLPQHC